MSDTASIGGVRDRRWVILGVISLAQLMVVLDLTVMNIALPSAQRALHFTTVDRQWVVTAYTLAFGSLLLLGGRLADLLGRKVTFLTGLAGFAGVSATSQHIVQPEPQLGRVGRHVGPSRTQKASERRGRMRYSRSGRCYFRMFTARATCTVPELRNRPLSCRFDTPARPLCGTHCQAVDDLPARDPAVISIAWPGYGRSAATTVRVADGEPGRSASWTSVFWAC